MSTYEKFERMREIFGADDLLLEIYEWFPTHEMDEALEDIARTWDVELEE